MSWFAVIVLAFGAYGFKAAGLLGVGSRIDQARWGRVLGLFPPALLAALVVVQTVGSESGWSIDARLPGVLVGGALAIRGAPFPVILIGASLVTAGLRAVS